MSKIVFLWAFQSKSGGVMISSSLTNEIIREMRWQRLKTIYYEIMF